MKAKFEGQKKIEIQGLKGNNTFVQNSNSWGSYMKRKK